MEFIYGLDTKAVGKVGDSLWIHDLKEGNALLVYYYTCKMLVPLRVLQKSLHKQRSGDILVTETFHLSHMFFFWK